MKRIAIIGAGMAGLSLAHKLHAKAAVTVFEKARGVGGRMSARYASPYAFDHGAQYFTARSDAFRHFLDPLLQKGVVAEWTPKLVTLAHGQPPQNLQWAEPHYVALPHMNGLCKAIGADLTIRTGVEIAPLTPRTAEGWVLHDTNGQNCGMFDHVASTAPAPQTARLYAPVLSIPSPPAMAGCYALMLGWPQPWPAAWDAAQVENSPIEWISVNSSKPGRATSATSLIVHASAAWSQTHIDADQDWVQATLLDALTPWLPMTAAPEYCSLHRWRYARVEGSTQGNPLHVPALELSAAGDWTGAARVEDAWLQATALADELLRTLT